ncbi:enoyl-CoA hydratase/isomerase family protein [bacterium]|nr:enoyl-CoA hydratase/isomerase family protein [bacterium]
MQLTDFKDILYQADGNGLVTVTLNIPKRKNAMSPYTFYELYWAVDHFERDEKLGAMVITGAKDPDVNDPQKEAFSSGGYFNESAFNDVSDELKKEIDISDIAQKRLTLKMFGCYKPIIAAINGLAIGAGFTMPFAGADLIYMSEYAWIRLPFAQLGIISELASSFLLPRYVGFQKAKEIIYFSKKLTAKEALELGLVSDVILHENLLLHAKDKALALIPPRGAGLAIGRIKKSMHEPFIEAISKTLDLENEGLGFCVKTADFGEGLMARIEKRDPRFTGK